MVFFFHISQTIFSVFLNTYVELFFTCNYNLIQGSYIQAEP